MPAGHTDMPSGHTGMPSGLTDMPSGHTDMPSGLTDMPSAHLLSGLTCHRGILTCYRGSQPSGHTAHRHTIGLTCQQEDKAKCGLKNLESTSPKDPFMV